MHTGDTNVIDVVKFGTVETNPQRTAITKSASRHIGTRKECADIMTSMFFWMVHYNQWDMFTKHSTVQNQSSIVGDLSVSTLEFCF